MTDTCLILPIDISNVKRISFAFYDDYLTKKYPGLKIHYLHSCIELEFADTKHRTMFILLDGDKF